MAHAIVSYDGSALDRDALALGALLRDAGSELTLAYVRHAPETRVDRELIADVSAEGRLRDGAARLADPGIDLRVVMHPSTAGGLDALAVALQADVLVFGSEYRTPDGRVGVGRAAATLMESGPAAIALAPAGYEARAGGDVGLARIGILPATADEAAIETAYALAERHGAQVTDSCHAVDLIVVGSGPHASPGRVMVSAQAAGAIEEARAPVLVTARDVPLRFPAPISVY